MEQNEGFGRVSFDLDGLFAVLEKLLDTVLSIFRPMTHFLTEISSASWLGASICFSIFFAVFIIRAGARSGLANIGAFAAALEHYAAWGLIACGAALGVMGLEWAVMPLWAVVVTVLANTFDGSEPGIWQALAFLATPSPSRAAFFDDLARFWSEGHTVLPLGFRLIGFISVAFGTMWLVARGMKRLPAS